MSDKIKVALVHDYLKEYGGAERVLEALYEIWPEAQIYTTVYLPEFMGPHRERIKEWNVVSSLLNKIPFKAKLISPFRLITPLVFRSMDFSKFDLVLVSATGAYSPNSINKGKALHVCYCHTPPRYLYGYPTAREWKKNLILRALGEFANHFLRIEDFKSSKNVDYFITNSKETASRVKKFYKREADVIYPPVDLPTQTINLKSSRENYYLAGGRLARAKRIDLAIEACVKLGLNLKVFGKEFGGYGSKLRKKYSSKVEFLGEVTDQEKWEAMSLAKAYIFPSEYEDFGIVVVESMSVGTPVIALRSGGVVETVVEGETGVFFDNPTVKSLASVLKDFENGKYQKISSKKCIIRAKRFSKSRFQKKIRDYIESKIR
jgi:glycosyltransferase involved in cell wall biosynthesis